METGLLFVVLKVALVLGILAFGVREVVKTRKMLDEGRATAPSKRDESGG